MTVAKMLSSVLEDAAKARAWDIFDFFQEQGQSIFSLYISCNVREAQWGF